MAQVERNQEQKRSERRARAKARADEWAKAEWEGFIDFYVTEAEWKVFDALDLEVEFVPLEWLEVLLNEGFKFGVNRDKEGTYLASMYAQWLSHPCAGMMLTAFAETPFEAMAALWFKHMYLCGGEFERVLERASGKQKPKRG